jgi:hypothetical protein
VHPTLTSSERPALARSFPFINMFRCMRAGYSANVLLALVEHWLV